ncbi:hypothetical protein M8C21_018920, partial [Ambrosia artemisiifolia]
AQFANHQVQDFGAVRMTDMPRGEIYAEPPKLMHCESRYLTSLWVSGNKVRSNSTTTTTTTGLELGAAYIDPNNHRIQDKIEAALQVLTFREQHVLVQFWWPHEFGKHQVLTTIDQPFGVGVLDAGLSSYRRDSEGRSFVVDKDHEEENCSPAARVFRRGLPEWTPDVTNYMPKHFPQQECAISCNLHGYLALPVFDLNTPLCVGVLELLTSSKYISYAYEVQQIHKALETVDLSTPQAYGYPTSNVPNEHRQKDFQNIHGILKMACDIHSLLLAQTWAVSEHSSFVSHEKACGLSSKRVENDTWTAPVASLARRCYPTVHVFVEM